MKFRIILLVSFVVFYAESQAQEFVCGFEPASESEVRGASTTSASSYASGTQKMLILFGKFSGDTSRPSLSGLKGRDGIFNQSANNLLKRDKPGSLAHFFHEMSFGQLTLTSVSDNPTTPQAENEPFWVNSDQAGFSNYVTVPAGMTCKQLALRDWRTGVRTFALEVIENADDVITLTKPDEVVVAVVTPRVFGDECGPVGTALTNLSGLTIDGVPVRQVITADYRSGFPYLVGTFAHEYGHVMDLDELFDRDKDEDHNMDGNIDDVDFAYDSAGIGRWGVMGRGVPGWVEMEGTEDGPNPMIVYSRLEVGWLTAANRLVNVTGDMINVAIHDINSKAGRAYKIEVPGSSSEYFLLANRQNTYSETRTSLQKIGSYYDDRAKTSGLAIWHVDEGVRPNSLDAVKFEQHKRIDLECADGLFSDKGYPDGRNPDAVAGGDNLDYWSHNSSYRQRYKGNEGDDQTDLWNGATTPSETDFAFTNGTNPSTAGYDDNGTPGNLEDDRQIVPTGIAVRNISSSGGIVRADILLNYWTGPITANTTWSGTVTVGGDVTIPAGVTLTINPNTTVRLSGSGDVMASGLDETKAELVVYGTLIAEGVTFTSADESADDAKWGGLVLYGDPLTHTTSSVVQGCTIEKATTGVHLETVEWTLGGATIGTGNRIRNCDLGLHIKGNSGSLRFDPRGNVIRNNTIEGCRRGLQIERASGTRIEQNLFTGSGPYKIQVWGQRSDNTQIVNNTLHSTGGNRGKGIHFKGGTSGVVRNTIASGFPQGGVVAQAAVSLHSLRRVA